MDKILVATDFSSRSDRAIRRASLIARRTNAALALVHVVDGDQAASMVDAESFAARATLIETVFTLQETDGVSASAIVKVDDVCSGIIAAAGEVGAQLVVIGPHRKRLRDIFTGTTVERLVRSTPVPLLVAVQTPSALYARTLLALDFDEASRAAAQAAWSLGVFEHTTVVGVHVSDAPIRGKMQRASETKGVMDAYLASERREAAERLQRMVSEIRLPLKEQLVVLSEGTVAQDILATAEKESADLIVVGTNKRKGFDRFMVGSVTEDVLRDARRDILIVPVDCAESAAATEGA